MSFHLSQSFTHGEQPSATKWNYLWENDYALQDWSAFTNATFPIALLADASITAAKLKRGRIYRRQGGDATQWATNGTTTYDVSSTDVIMQAGVIRTSASADVGVTFPVAYSATPIVLFGAKLVNNSIAPRIPNTGVSTTGFSVSAVITSTGTRSADDIHWLAIGPA